jgi:cytochrome c-type biogenesis protein
VGADLSLNPATLLFAVGAGVLSFISPCVLPLLPAYLSFITGLSAEQLGSARDAGTRARILGQSLAFVAGLAIVFTLLGASASLIGRLLLVNLDLVGQVAGLLVIAFGLHMAGVLRIPLLERRAGAEVVARPGGPVRALLLGAAFAAGWTPCVGPFLASLLTLASQERTVGSGTLLLFAYALGLGLPFVLAGLAMERALRVMRALRPYLHRIEVASGALLVGMGLLLFTGRLALLSGWLTRIFGNGLAA